MLGEIQAAVEKVSNAWDRADDSNGHLLSCHELHFEMGCGCIGGAFRRKSVEEAT